VDHAAKKIARVHRRPGAIVPAYHRPEISDFPYFVCEDRFSSAGGDSGLGRGNATLLAHSGHGVDAAGRTVRVLADPDRVEAGAQRVVDQQGAIEAVAEPQKFLEHLDRL
jgi:hypothetical protein